MRLASNVVWFALWKLRFGQIGPRTAGRKAHVEIPLRTYAVIGGSSNPLRTKTIECPLASRHFARLAVGLEVFLGFGALFGGGALILAPDGHLLGMPVKLLAGSPFPSFLVPGIILFGLIGVAPLMAAAITLRRQELAPLSASRGGVDAYRLGSGRNGRAGRTREPGMDPLPRAWRIHRSDRRGLVAFVPQERQSFGVVMTPLGGHFGIDLYWLPLGAGGNFVRLNGPIYEAIKARLDRRPVCDLYHSALQVFVPEGRYVIENTPVIDEHGRERGVVMEGPIGAHAPDLDAQMESILEAVSLEELRWRLKA